MEEGTVNIVLIQKSFGRRHIVGIDERHAEKLPADWSAEDAFEAFNGYGPNSHLRKYADYSMSTGDVVGINDCWYRCDDFGWTEIKKTDVLDIVVDVLNNMVAR